ncbi:MULTISPECIES: HAD family hydrolase [Thermotoga]|jgi:beta-phosphoglucomutase family hydrolase|uniref:Phosphorylated carbohydrates phosphatase TM_1254 n=3 Tax=Thermotoga TaxID=2335 RepID=P1254_THEMA|nr:MULTISPECIES: HAD family phosphatase [Thermotoga]Q9X0Y1.1 RecName: Full=Phosphorylated carbohydrates phosphatase TM_1254 [Thermotoga maritima MSB8]KUK23029.1 MAG: Phosphorylated carbohydrates phosphatase [Thermotoga petrophila]KUK33574.1 MAG: Phosphorylated carbohydrates phosphatase [Thermotoga sp. 47_83]MBZ4661232.1 haloacid dehalogenase [Thermotoga sp.]AAD36329.1 beta-phosphoglucomutase, putative [Thermotoga maritima MSB8]ADA67616.1 HAD-superfamily hydrolase, subfamily IA, variant 3 [The
MEAVIFDMDGVLMDTEPLYFEAYRRVAESYGKPYTEDLHRRIMGVPEREGLPILMEALEIKDSLENFKKRVHEEKKRVFSELLKENPGVREALEFVKSKRIKLALATSTPQREALERLRRLDLEKYFDVMVFGDQVKNGKPDPEIYLLVLERLNVVPEKVVVFEDSKSGVEAAKSAGIERIYGVVHSLNDGKALLEAGAVALVKPEEILNVLKEVL